MKNVLYKRAQVRLWSKRWRNLFIISRMVMLSSQWKPFPVDDELILMKLFQDFKIEAVTKHFSSSTSAQWVMTVYLLRSGHYQLVGGWGWCKIGRDLEGETTFQCSILEDGAKVQSNIVTWLKYLMHISHGIVRERREFMTRGGGIDLRDR